MNKLYHCRLVISVIVALNLLFTLILETILLQVLGADNAVIVYTVTLSYILPINGILWHHLNTICTDRRTDDEEE